MLSILASLSLTISPTTELAQRIGDGAGETCRTIALTPESTLYLYPRPISYADNDTAIAPVFDTEQIHLVRANVPGVDGDVRTWHEIVDSIGNRGYILAFDPATDLSTLRYCQ
ncbi:hypothetical protein [Baaleninema simplex]|uniref:hypothetical protein n=1 Tax=Baaleninema simplex TaxID=2862350 RepID=UPI00034DC3C0|nr:hypothetical protein [Baaleninema simplex]